jgi:hypothetical protein
VPPDEHQWIEKFGCTRRYRAFRDGVRQYYRDHYPLTEAARNNPTSTRRRKRLSAVSRAAAVAVAVIDAMLQWRGPRGC